jgi:hypothetical protein
MPVSSLRRVSVTAAAATFVGLGALAATPAQAASAELSYTCTLFSLPPGIELPDLSEAERQGLRDAVEGDVEGLEALLEEVDFVEVPGLKLTASFDSAIDAPTAPVGTEIELSPVQTRITLPTATAAALGELNLPVAMGGSYLVAGFDESGAERDVLTEFEGFAAGDGTFSATGEGEAESYVLEEAGQHTYLAGDLFVVLSDPQENFAYLECTLDEGQDSTIDVITARAATTTPPAPAPAPVRPEVVQTDAAQPTSPSWLPLAAAGAGSVLVLGAASHVRRRRVVRD